eukprot:1057243-Rhodomonas_salina.1
MAPRRRTRNGTRDASELLFEMDTDLLYSGLKFLFQTFTPESWKIPAPRQKADFHSPLFPGKPSLKPATPSPFGNSSK